MIDCAEAGGGHQYCRNIHFRYEINHQEFFCQGYKESAGAFDNINYNGDPAIERNADMGGTNFGINDSSSWDDAGSADVGGGGDWDN